jgi:glutamate synthase domain-containing protein 2
VKEIIIYDARNLEPLKPTYVLVANVDLVLIKFIENNQENISVLYGRCMHRGALMSDGSIDGGNIICGLHNWDYSYKTGVSSYNPSEKLYKFRSWIKEGQLIIDENEIKDWEIKNPQNYNRDKYQGLYEDNTGTIDEPHNKYIRHLSEYGLTKLGHHGKMDAMGVSRNQLPKWEDIQILTAQLYKLPLLDDEKVATKVIIGKTAKKPLILDIPLFVSDMSFGSLSFEAKIALAKGAELAGTGICSGEGGMLNEEQQSNSKYFYEMASAKFGFSIEKVKKCQAFHFKLGQGAKTGTGGHLPAKKVLPEIAKVRGLKAGEDAISPATFEEFKSLADYKNFANNIRKETGGIPIGVKLSAQHIEKDIKAAVDIGVDYIILDGRGGGTGAAPFIFRAYISVPTIPALARARKYLDSIGSDISLIITGGLRTPDDFIKALALGADAIAVSNSAIQAIGCLGMRACHTNNCPVGIATQKDDLRKRLQIDKAANQLNNFFNASTHLIKVMARACGHNDINKFNKNDLTAWKKDIANLTGIEYGGFS